MIGSALEQGAQMMNLSLPQKSIKLFEYFVGELKKWNSKINLTTITDDKEIAAKHILDALFFARYVKDGEQVLDIGSGAGFPAIPLKIAKPDVSVVSVDAVAKKIYFQRHVARMMEFRDFEALHSRIEDMRMTHAYRFDVITSRAFSSLEQFVLLAAPLLSVKGRIIAMKGPMADEEIAQATNVLASLGFQISQIYPYSLPFDCGERRLVVITPCKHL